MKRAGNLIEPIAVAENLKLAFWKAARSKARKAEVLNFRANLDVNLACMRAGFLQGSMKFGDYYRFRIFDPKERQITAPAFSERVAHHAIMNVCEPILERCSIHHSYACRRGKGQFAALEQATRNARRFRYFLQLDIRKYFDSIDQQRLLSLLSCRFKDSALLGIFRRMLESYRVSPGKGLPIGALTSQHFANFYLGGLDRLIIGRAGLGYVRYMDDFVVWGNDRRELCDLAEDIAFFLSEQLRLQLKREPNVARSGQGMPFLGYKVLGWGLLLTPRSKRRFVRHLRNVRRAYLLGIISEDELQHRLVSIFAVARHARSWRFRRQVLETFGGASMGLEARDAGRELEQSGRELPLCEPQQERSVQQEQQCGISGGLGPQLSREESDDA